MEVSQNEPPGENVIINKMKKQTKTYQLINEEENLTKAILVAVCTDGEPNSEEFVHALEEMQDLIEACDMEVVRWVTQVYQTPHPATYVGEGKLEEIKEYAALYGAQMVVTLDNLSPSQLKNIGDIVDVPVMDRTSLILEIFSKRAKTREARLQVELANLKYSLPRLVGMRKNLGRQAGASGTLSNKGAGEKQIDLDRRRIERRITQLERELKEIEYNRETQRKSRERGNLPKVALVGYTNAGKSTVMNRIMEMSGQDEEKKVFEKDMLFATLDTTVRRVSTKDKRDFLLSDTVGFISDLPHDLIRAFHSTLEEVCFADLLLIVIDISDSHFKDQLAVTENTLKELSADMVPRLYVYNKVDKLEADPENGVVTFKPGTVSGDRLYISAANGGGLDVLIESIKRNVYSSNELLKLLVPYSQGSVAGKIRANAVVLKEEYREDGIYFEIDCPGYLSGSLKENPDLRFF